MTRMKIFAFLVFTSFCFPFYFIISKKLKLPLEIEFNFKSVESFLAGYMIFRDWILTERNALSYGAPKGFLIPTISFK